MFYLQSEALQPGGIFELACGNQKGSLLAAAESLRV